MARRKGGLGIVFNVPASACAAAQKRVQASARFWDKHASGRKGGARSLPSADLAKRGLKDPATNRDRTVVEVCRFKARKTAAPFVGYVKQPKKGGLTVTTWTGVRLCTVHHKTGKTGIVA